MKPLHVPGWAAVCQIGVGGNRGGSSNNSGSGTSSGGGEPNSSLGPYPDDNSRRLPIANSLSALEAGRRARAAIVARSGRASTRLASAGTSSYVNNSVGGLN